MSEKGGVNVSAEPDERELTSTLHLGLRSLSQPVSTNEVDEYLQTATAQERATIEEIQNGDSSRAMIIIHRGPQKGSRFLITSEGVAIGRSPESSIFLDDVTVSRKHCAIAFNSQALFEISDLGSLNGTYLNNTSVTQSILANGDQIQVGKFHMIFVSHVHQKQSGEK